MTEKSDLALFLWDPPLCRLSMFLSKWNLDVKKKQIKAEQALGLAAQQTAREVGIAQQQTARDIGVAGHGRYATTGSAWAESTPKIVFAVALGLVGIVAVKTLR